MTRFAQRARNFCTHFPVVGLAAVLATFVDASAQTPERTVRVGIVNPLQGPAASAFGISGDQAAKMMVDAINEGILPAPYNTPGLAGGKITPVYLDETGSISSQVQDFRNLVSRDSVEAVIGYVSSGSCLAIAPVAEELKMLTVLYDCATPRIYEERDYRYVFRTTGTATADAVAAARYTVEMMPNLENYGGINQNYAWGQDAWRDYQLAMSHLLPTTKPAFELFPQLFAGQYGDEISKIAINRPQALMSSFWGGDLESFVLQATLRGLGRQTQLVLLAAETTVFTLKDKLPSGAFIGGRGGSEGVFVQDTPLSQWFRQEYKARYGNEPTSLAYLMARSFLALKIAYDKAGPQADTEGLVNAMEYLEFESFGTNVKLSSGKGRQAVTDVSFATSSWNADLQVPEFKDVRVYPAACVTPPSAMTSQEWLEKGMPGADCD